MAVAFVSASTPITAGSGSPINVMMPPSLAVGNVVVVHFSISVGPTPTTPTGWTKAYDANANAIFWHVITGAESWYPSGGTVAFASTGTNRREFSAQYSGVSATAPVGEVVALMNASNGTALPSLSLSGSVPAGALVAYSHESSVSSSITADPAGYTSQIAGSAVGHLFTKALAAPETPTSVTGSSSTSTRHSAALYSLLEPSTTNATVNAVTATATLAAPAPTVTAQRNVSIAAPTATATLTAPAPGVAAQRNVTVSAPAATATITAPSPTVSTSRNITNDAPAATATIDAPAPSVTTTRSVTINAPAALATIAAPAPDVTAQRNVTIDAPAATAVLAAPAPTVHVRDLSPGAILVTVTEHPLQVLITDRSRRTTITEHPRTVTIREASR